MVKNVAARAKSSQHCLYLSPTDQQPVLLRYDKSRRLLYAITIFWSAYLLFQIEPLIGKFILPWFGGSPAVWTSCVLFFQLLLLAGYAYAHFILHYLPAARQGHAHIMLLLCSIMAMPITPAASWHPEADLAPILAIPLLLFQSIGLPFFILSTTSALLQAWHVRICPTHSPYHLYALSNFGSFLALLSYPFIFEPYFKLSQQTLGWSVGYGLFVVFCIGLAYDFRKHAHASEIVATPKINDGETLISSHLNAKMCWFFWISLPTATSILLLAVTNQLCQDVASVPFLWILPLSLYLISFIICFAKRKWYSRAVFIPCALIAAVAMVYTLYNGSNIGLIGQIVIYNLGLFFCCMICHGELYRLRPQPSLLTRYYLGISLGGAIGGLFVAIIAPLVFYLYLEFHIGLFACFSLLWLALLTDKSSISNRKNRLLFHAVATSILALLGGHLFLQAYYATTQQIALDRNFYGVLRVEERADPASGETRRVLRHGAIDHGFQYASPQKRRLATAYYWPGTGAGLLMQLQHKPKRRIGLVGLGVGTLLAYSKPDDYFRIYDINPKIVEFAETYFSYLQDSPAQHDIVIADARLALARETPQNFDLLLLDAFSGDAVPMHLLTAEAMQLYFKHLQSDGVLAIHITNHYLNFRPLLQAWAESNGYQCLFIHAEPPAYDNNLYRADWALMSKNQDLLQQPQLQAAREPYREFADKVVWTDDFSNLFRLLK